MNQEIKEALQKRVIMNLKEIANMEPSIERESLMKEVNDILTQLHDVDQLTLEYGDKEARRDIEYEKIRGSIRQEQEKQTVTWQRAALEMAKVIVPTGISVMTYIVLFHQTLKFEESGHFTSSAFRMLPVSKLMK